MSSRTAERRHGCLTKTRLERQTCEERSQENGQSCHQAEPISACPAQTMPAPCARERHCKQLSRPCSKNVRFTRLPSVTSRSVLRHERGIAQRYCAGKSAPPAQQVLSCPAIRLASDQPERAVQVCRRTPGAVAIVAHGEHRHSIGLRFHCKHVCCL